MKVFGGEVRSIRRYKGEYRVVRGIVGGDLMDIIEQHAHAHPDDDTETCDIKEVDTGQPEHECSGSGSCNCIPVSDKTCGIVHKTFPFENGDDPLWNAKSFRSRRGSDGIGWRNDCAEDERFRPTETRNESM